MKTAAAQRKRIELDSYKSWAEVKNGGISPNGNFAFYSVSHGLNGNNDEVVVVSLKNKFTRKFKNASRVQFSPDSKELLGMLPGNILFRYLLTDNTISYVENVQQYETLEIEKKMYLVFKSVVGDSLILECKSEKFRFSVPGVESYLLNPNKSSILFLSKNENTNAGIKYRLHAFNFESKNTINVFESQLIRNLTFSQNGHKYFFIASSHDKNSLYLANDPLKKPVLLFEDKANSFFFNKDLTNEGQWRFSKDNNKIFFYIKSSQLPISDSSQSVPEIWNYKDAYLRDFYYGYDSYGSKNVNKNNYLCRYDIPTGTCLQLLAGNEKLEYNTFKYDTDSICIIESSFGLEDEEWNQYSERRYFLCNTATGEKKRIFNNNSRKLKSFTVSPLGNFIVFYDSLLGSYFSYNIKSNTLRNITHSLGVDLLRIHSTSFPRPQSRNVGIAGWVERDRYVLIQGTYDFFLVDLANATAPVSITSSKGYKMKTVFNIQDKNLEHLYSMGDDILLSGFNTSTKELGFYKVKLGPNMPMNKLSEAPVFSGRLYDIYSQLVYPDFIKAASCASYLIKFEKSNSSPNYFHTRDFIHFDPISDVQPQKEYNWLTTELHTYKDSTNNPLQGILYKPENFDPSKKYPVIFYYYTTKSNSLNQFMQVYPPHGDLNISLMVSNGYLAFTPDIYSVPGKPGDGALKSVVAAADHLKSFKFVNDRKLGLIGGSFGGYETNYIVTHSNRFAAGVSSSGISDLISAYTQVGESPNSSSAVLKYTDLKMARDLQDDPYNYLKNSPIFFTNRVSTPLLLMHNAKDNAVLFTQTRTFFVSLRSFRKKVWWLNYSDEGHALINEENKLDFQAKVLNFFDVFLKGKEFPDWMNKHI